MLFGMGFFEFVLVLPVAAIPLVACWRIVAKAGYPGALALLLFVPVVNLIAVYTFAFAEWPIERRLAGRHPS